MWQTVGAVRLVSSNYSSNQNSRSYQMTRSVHELILLHFVIHCESLHVLRCSWSTALEDYLFTQNKERQSTVYRYRIIRTLTSVSSSIDWRNSLGSSPPAVINCCFWWQISPIRLSLLCFWDFYLCGAVIFFHYFFALHSYIYRKEELILELKWRSHIREFCPIFYHGYVLLYGYLIIQDPPQAVVVPPGWEKCEDEEGAYYWHIKSGTIQREPPSPSPPEVKQTTLRSLSVKSNSVRTLVSTFLPIAHKRK